MFHPNSPVNSTPLGEHARSAEPAPKSAPQVLRFESLDLYDPNASAQQRKQQLEGFFRELVEKRANGDVGKLAAYGVDGEAGVKLKYTGTRNQATRTFHSLFTAYGLACYETDGLDPRQNKVNSRNIRKQADYGYSDLVARVKKDIFGIKPELVAQEFRFETLSRFNPDASALDRKSTLEKFFRELIDRRALGNSEKLTMDGVDGAKGLKFQFGDSTGRRIGQFRTLLLAYGLACFEADGFDPASAGVNTLNIYTQVGYGAADLIQRVKKDEFSVETQLAAADSRYSSLSKYDPKSAASVRKAALEEFFREFVERKANGEVDELKAYGSSTRHTIFANAMGQEVGTFRTILNAYGLACYEVDGADPKKSRVNTVNVCNQSGYSFEDLILRAKKDGFGIEAVSVAVEFKFASLSRYNPKASATERKATLENFFDELIARRAEGDASRLMGLGVDGQLGVKLKFADSEGQVFGIFKTILSYYGQACLEVDGHELKSHYIGTSKIFKQPNFSRSALLSRYHTSQCSAAMSRALAREDLADVCAHVKGETPISLCVFAQAVFRPDRNWGIPLGKDDGRELWIVFPDGCKLTSFPPKAVIVTEQLGAKPVLRVNLEQQQVLVVDYADLSSNKPSKPVVEKVRIAITDQINNLSRELTPEIIRDMSVRYFLPLSSSVWRAIGWQYQGLIEPEVGERLVREKLLEDVTPAFERRVTQSFDPLAATLEDPVKDQPQRVTVTADGIRRLAQVLTPEQTQQLQDSMRDIQAQAFLERLVGDLADELSYQGATLKQIREKLEQHRVKEPIEVLHRAYDVMLNRLEDYQAIVELLGQAGFTEPLRVNQLNFIASASAAYCTGYYNGDPMGGGKTRAALATVLLLNASETLVVCPPTACQRWLEEIGQMYAHTIHPLELVVLADEQVPNLIKDNRRISSRVLTSIADGQDWAQSRSQPEPGTHRLILSNNIRVAEVFANADCPAVFIVDEAHTIKNIETGTAAWICAQRSAGKVERIYLLSGTPVENDHEDLFVPLRLLYAGTNSPIETISLAQYRQMFAEHDVAGLSTLHGNLMARFSRTDVRRLIPDLPQVNKEFVMLDIELGTMRMGDTVVALPGDYTRQAVLYQEALLDIAKFERERVRQEGPEVAESVITPSTRPKRLSQILLNPELFDRELPAPASIKRDALVEMRRLEGDSTPTLIASDYVPAIAEARKALSEVGAQTALIDGSVRNSATLLARTNQINRFQTGQADTLLVTTGTMAFSEQLTKARRLRWLNLPDRPTVEDQMLGRIVRPDPIHNPPGKKVTEQVLCLEGASSIDLAYRRLLEHKRLFHEMLVLGNLSPEVAAQFAGQEVFLSQALARDSAAIAEYSSEHALMKCWRQALASLKRDTRVAETSGEIASAWNAVSELYLASVAAAVQVPLSEALLDVMLVSYWREGAKIRFLDAGAGTGCVSKARERMQNRFADAQVSLRITNYDVAATMQLFDSSSEQRVYGEFSELGSRFEDSNFDHVHFGHSFWYARDPVKLLEDSHRLLGQNGLLTIVLPSVYQFCPQFEGALERLGFFVDSGADSSLRAVIDQQTYQRIVDRLGTVAAEDAREMVVAGARILIARKLGDAEGERPLPEELIITKPAPRVSGATVQSLVQAPAWRDTIGSLGGVEGELIKHHALSADELSNVTICTSAVARHLRISFQLLSRVPNSGRAPDLNHSGLRQHVSLIDRQLTELSDVLSRKRCELDHAALAPLVGKVASLMCLQSSVFVNTACSPELANLKIRTLTLLGRCVPT